MAGLAARHRAAAGRADAERERDREPPEQQCKHRADRTPYNQWFGLAGFRRETVSFSPGTAQSTISGFAELSN